MFTTLSEYNKFLEATIDLNHNQIDDEATKALCLLLDKCAGIKQIDIDFNKITDASILELKPYLIKNIGIRCLNISYNAGITDKSLPILIDILKHSTLVDIRIKETSITDQNALLPYILANLLISGEKNISLSRRLVLLISLDYVNANLFFVSINCFINRDIKDEDMEGICNTIRDHYNRPLKSLELVNIFVTNIIFHFYSTIDLPLFIAFQQILSQKKELPYYSRP